MSIRVSKHFLFPNVSKQHFSSALFSEVFELVFCENFPQNFSLRQMLDMRNIRVKSLALQKDRGEG